MATYNELDAIDKYVYDRLAATSGLSALINTAGGFFKAFAGVAPRDCATAGPVVEQVAPPYVLWELLSENDVNALGAPGTQTRILVRPIIICRAVTQSSSYDTANAIADKIDAALHDGPSATPITGIMVMGFRRQQLVRTAEVVNGVRWNYVGGIYRGFVCQAP